MPNFTAIDAPFEIGKAQLLCTGSDVTIAATGHLVWKRIKLQRLWIMKASLQRSSMCTQSNPWTKTPFGFDLENRLRGQCGRTSALREDLANASLKCSARHPAPQEFVAVDDSFGESGKPEELLEKYGLSAAHIGQAVHRALKRK